MSLFDAAVDQVIKDAGDETLIAVDDRNSADYCKILWLVQRKKYFWHLPWKSPYKYKPTEISLNDLLEEPIDVQNLVKSSVLLENYQSTPSFHKSGRIGGKIVKEFNIDLSVTRVLEVELKLGNVMKKEITWEKLYETANKKKVKVDHPLVKMINESRKKKLFVISAVVTSGDEELSRTEDTTEHADGDGPVKPQVALNIKADVAADTKHHTQYGIPSGTSIGYSCDEIKFDSNGVLNLQLEEDIRK